MRRIGVLTSGGDAPGMNACIRAVVRAGLAAGLEVIGIRRGYLGLLAGELEPLERRDVVNVIQLGGTILGTGRAPRFEHRGDRDEARRVLAAAGIDGVVLIGGDGTLRGGQALVDEGGRRAWAYRARSTTTCWAPSAPWASPRPSTPPWGRSTGSATRRPRTRSCTWSR